MLVQYSSRYSTRLSLCTSDFNGKEKAHMLFVTTIRSMGCVDDAAGTAVTRDHFGQTKSLTKIFSRLPTGVFRNVYA